MNAEVVIMGVVGMLGGCWLLITDPVKTPNAEELVAMGWPAGRLRSTTVTFTLIMAAVAGVAVRVVSGSWPWAITVGLALSIWLQGPVLTVYRWGLLEGYRPARDKALLSWLRRVHMFVAAGSPINAAVLSAAERVTDKAFGPVATAISAALATSTDPIQAVSGKLKGSKAGPLVATLAKAEAKGTAAGGLINSLLGRAVRELASERREAITRLGKKVENASTIVSLTGGILLMAGVMGNILV